MYLNCPDCGLSIRRAYAPAPMESCPRCLGRVGRPIPLFRTERPYRHVAEREGSTSLFGRPDADAA